MPIPNLSNQLRRRTLMKQTLNMLRAAFAVMACLFVLLTPVDSSAQNVATVNGGGTAILTDYDSGITYPLQFGLVGVVKPDGSAVGHVNFVFPEPFAAAWGAVPGVNRITIAGQVTSGEIAADGTVIIEGMLIERDYSNGLGVVFFEENVPFRIEVGGSLGSQVMHLQWCFLPTFRIEVGDGNLTIH
jgi:hypothetical protein